MCEFERRSVKADAWPNSAAVKRIAEYRESMLGSVDADLMSATCHRYRFDKCRSILPVQNAESRLSSFTSRVERSADIAFTHSHEGRYSGERRLVHGPVRQEEIFLANTARSELFGQRFVRERRLAEDQYAGSFLIKTMQNGKVRPARFPMAQPVVNAFASVRRRSMGIVAGRFVHHEQVVVFEQNRGRHG